MNKINLHYNILHEFNKKLYSNFISATNLKEEIVIKDQEFWLAEYNKQRYLLTQEIVDDLPIVVTSEDRLKYAGKVWHVVTGYKSVKINPEKKFSFREMVDLFEFKLSTKHQLFGDGQFGRIVDYSEDEMNRNKLHNLLFRIIMFGAEIGRVNFRVSTAPGFGKDSIASLLGFLMNDVAVSSPRSVASIEYRLLNKILVLNEVGNLNSEQTNVIWKLLETLGDYKDVYEKSTRATSMTFDKYDVSKLSLIVFYNRKEDYLGKEDKFFDNVFGTAVQDRFIPFKFEGIIDKKQFKKTPDVQSELEENYQIYLGIVKSIWWYRDNFASEIQQYSEIIDEFVETHKFWFDRQSLSFYKLGEFLGLYAKDEEELKFLLNGLYGAYTNYYSDRMEKQDPGVIDVTEWVDKRK